MSNPNAGKPVLVKTGPDYNDLTQEQRRIALGSLRKLVSAIQIELPFVFVERDGKRCYTLSAKRGAVVVDVVVTTEIPK